jgi:hypothetical protein
MKISWKRKAWTILAFLHLKSSLIENPESPRLFHTLKSSRIAGEMVRGIIDTADTISFSFHDVQDS